MTLFYRPKLYKKNENYRGLSEQQLDDHVNVLEIGPLHRNSFKRLLKLPRASYDLIYFEVCWSAIYILREAIAAWPLLKNNGTFILDLNNLNEENLPLGEHPTNAIESFIKMNSHGLEVNYQDSFVILKKIKITA